MVKIIECPRDAMQGLHAFIPTAVKVKYINQLLKVGFDTIDFGSFVSPKAIPQLKDTAEVLDALDMESATSRLLAIVANTRGANDATRFQEIDYVGFPLSLSETFQKRNTNKSIKAAFDTVREIQDLCLKTDKVLVIYLSMGFGNPYGDPYEMEYVTEFVKELDDIGIEIVSLADTIGVSSPETIHELFSTLVGYYPHIEFGAHLHADKSTSESKIATAYHSGCRRFDGAINGFGGCPMADDKLVGNIATETIINCLEQLGVLLTYDKLAIDQCIKMAPSVFRS